MNVGAHVQLVNLIFQGLRKAQTVEPIIGIKSPNLIYQLI